MTLLKKLYRFKSYIKKNRITVYFYELLFQRDIYNLFNSTNDKKVLISYSTYHFKNKNYIKHSNYQESIEIAKIFDELGYQVDVTNNNRNCSQNFDDYDIIFGEGTPMYQSINSRAYKIYYGTGSHPFHCSNQSYIRLIDYYNKSKYLAEKSLRVNAPEWGIAASTADAVICIGNDITKKTFIDYKCNNVYTVVPTFHRRNDAIEIGQEKDFSKCRKSILWFGSYGLLHKGLDLIVEAAREAPEWSFHICGYLAEENELLESMQLPDNVILHGFVNILSDEFKALCLCCGFVILPSCSEGIATAVVTAVANGAMIPLVTKQCGFDIDDYGFLIDLNSKSIINNLANIDELSFEVLKTMSEKAQHETLRRYTLDNYKNMMSDNLKKIILENKL